MVILNNKYLIIRKLKENKIYLNDIFLEKIDNDNYFIYFVKSNLKETIKGLVSKKSLLITSDNDKIFKILEDNILDIIEYDENYYLRHVSISINFWDADVIEDNFKEDFGREPTDEDWEKIDKEEYDFYYSFLRKLEKNGIHNIAASSLDCGRGHVLEFYEPTEDGIKSYLKFFKNFHFSILDHNDDLEGYNEINLYEFEESCVSSISLEIPKGCSLYYKILEA